MTTKLYLPRPPAGVIARPQLLARLSAGLDRKLTLISAPAGFGKSTLLAQWLNPAEGAALVAPAERIAWLSLDKNDNDPGRFLAYLAAAVATLSPTSRGVVEATMQETQPPSTNRVLTVMLNELAQLEHPSILVLDDLHLVEQQAVHDALTFLLEHQPPRMHLVIATRSDPLLPLSRLRARGQMTEVRAADLRFTLPEAAAFLHQTMDLELSSADVAALLDRTEGWVAGLQLTGLSLQNREDVTSFVATITGSHAYIADYLEDEVFRIQPEKIRQFLLETACLDRLSGPLCDAVTGRSDGQIMLEQLQQSNLFLMALDSERHWFRYHSLFADLLRQRLQRSHGERLPELHRRASLWHEQQGHLPEAIEHALSAGDWQRASRLVEAVAEAHLQRSELTTLIDWARRLPEAWLNRRQRLAAYYAWALWLSGRPMDEVQAWLPTDDDPDCVPAQVLPMHAFINLLEGREAEAVDMSEQALTHLPERDRFLRSLALWVQRLAALHNVDPDAGAYLLEKSTQPDWAPGNLFLTTLALCNKAELHFLQGQLQEAEIGYRRALQLASDESGQRLPPASGALIGLGSVAYEWNELAEAEKLLLEGLALTELGMGLAALDGLIYLAQVKQAQGDWPAAARQLERATALAARFDAIEIDDWMVALARARLNILAGNLAPARQWVHDSDLLQVAGPTYGANNETTAGRQRKYELLVLVRFLLAEGEFEQALAILEPLRHLLEARGRLRPIIEAHNLMALVYQGLGRQPEALEALETALALAEPGQHIRLFVDEGRPMARLLYLAVEQAIFPDYGGRLLATFPAFQAGKAMGQELVQALSPRELEVLALIAQGQSNQEIAAALVLSVSTVKVHAHHIYQKLEVSNRTEAVARARTLGIL